jgi:CubicO group peptidase (beta-lactamase class C family)
MSKVFDRRSFVAGLTAAAAATIAPAPNYARHLTSQHGAIESLLPDIPNLSAASPQSVGVVADISARIGTFMQRHLDAGHLSGGVTALTRRGKLIHFAAHGMLDVEAGTPMPTDGIFRIMSLGKPVTGAALLQQMETGKIALEDKISKFIPELKEFRVRVGDSAQAPGTSIETVPANREITIRDLATHTSGLNGFLLDIPASVPFTLAARVPYARNLSFDFQPGTRWAYSAVTGPDILARIVEITSGLSFDRHIKERIFEPVGMRDAAFNLDVRQRARVVPRYARKHEAWHREPNPQLAGVPPVPVGVSLPVVR